MRFPTLDRHFTGVSVPVAALRTDRSCGVGEFADLPALGAWCRSAGLDLIQLLPVNDTGGNSSPYSAVSAFALHPLYLRLDDLPGSAACASELAAFRAETAAAESAVTEREGPERAARGRFDYPRVLSFKLGIVERLFDAQEKSIRRDTEFSAWRAANPWCVAHAVFTAARATRDNAPWRTWGGLADPRPEDIAAWWDAHERACLTVAWAQFHLERQLAAASRALADLGVFLKGDLPILMSVESADVWAERRYFDLDARAGAPPDMFSPDGQNWGFPVYDWERLAADGYGWWKDRLRQAGKFFHAFRIDHVLGFFRIWRIPRGETSGLLGWFSPSDGLTRADLRGLGFDDGRVRWLTVPHIRGDELAAALGADAARIEERYLRQVGAEDLWNIDPALDSESAIDARDEPDAVRSFLRSWHANRALLDDGNGSFYPAWYRERSAAMRSLSDDERFRLEDIVSRRRTSSEADWEARGRRLLAELQSATDMLVCAEDLGDVPRCVPRVLSELGILGLKIVRWYRDYDAVGPGAPAPFIPLAAYPELSVCTPSVHDTSTLRGWWEEDAGEREAFFSTLGIPGPCPARMTPDLLRRIARHCAEASSALVMFQVQDLLDLDESLWSADPRDDRINVPGTVNSRNWTWRMPIRIEDLGDRVDLLALVRDLTARRRAWPLRRKDGR